MRNRWVVALIVTGIIPVTTFAWSLVEDGKPAATIVLPARPTRAKADAEPSAATEFLLKSNLHAALTQAAKVLQEHVREITGAELPIVEGAPAAKGRRILLGDAARRTDAAGNDELGEDYVLIRADGDDLLIRGRERAAFDGRYPRMCSGSAEAVYWFIERQLGVRWYAPGPAGRELPARTPSLKVPDDLSLRITPSVRYGGLLGRMAWHRMGRASEHGLLRMVGGHTWGLQVPPEVYFNKEKRPETYHPEYYPLVAGRRITDADHGGSLCTSNPDVLKLSVAWVRGLFDAGFDVVELGQPDAYSDTAACHCDACMKIGDTSPAGLGARIWEFHLAIAAEVATTHPDKRVLPILYGPSYRIPDCVQGPLPRNVALEFSGSRGEIFNLMDRLAALKPSATTIYLYEFTAYHPLGYGGPKSSIEQITEIFRDARKNNVAFVYWCGWADSNFGLEGHLYWLAQQLQWDWTRDPAALMSEYWRGYYHAAAGEMEALFGFIETQKRTKVSARWPKTETESFTSHFVTLRGAQVYSAVFDEEMSRGVAERLARARAAAAGDAVVLRRIAAVAEAWRFNELTAACYEPSARFQQSGSVADLETLAKALAARRTFLADLRKRSEAGEFADFCPPVLPEYVWRDERARKSVDECGPFQGPFALDAEAMIAHIRKHPLKTAVLPRVAGKPDAKAWQNVPALALVDNTGTDENPFPTEVRTAWDEKALYVHFACREGRADHLVTKFGKARDGRVWADDDVEVFIGQPEESTQYYQFLVNPAGVLADLSRGWPRFDLDPDPLKPNLEWNGEWEAVVDVSAAPALWTATLTIPFKTLGFAPQPGAAWRMNFGRFRPRKSDQDPKAGYALSWNPTFGELGTTGRFGLVTFGK